MSCLSEDFHKAIHYGKKILNAKESISLTEQKIVDANKDVSLESEQWKDLPLWNKAYNIYDLMLNGDGKSGLKAIVTQCLASILRWKISKVPDGIKQDKMFDLDLYGYKIDEEKKAKLKAEIEKDSYIGYIANAIKYAAGETI